MQSDLHGEDLLRIKNVELTPAFGSPLLQHLLPQHPHLRWTLPRIQDLQEDQDHWTY